MLFADSSLIWIAWGLFDLELNFEFELVVLIGARHGTGTLEVSVAGRSHGGPVLWVEACYLGLTPTFFNICSVQRRSFEIAMRSRLPNHRLTNGVPDGLIACVCIPPLSYASEIKTTGRGWSHFRAGVALYNAVHMNNGCS